MRSGTAVTAALTLGLALWACNGATSSPAGRAPDGGLSPAPDAQGFRPGDDAGSVGTVAIYLTADSSERTYDDELRGQTPRDFRIALSRYYLLTSAADPAPVLCFDHGADPAVASIEQDVHVGTCATATVPTAVYTHGRVKVDWVSYTVEGTVHSEGVAYPGSVEVFRAYSDTTHHDKAYVAGEGVIGFRSAALDNEVDVTYPALPQLAGVHLELVDGELLMTFPYTTPLPMERSNTEHHWARFHWEVFEGYRWRDSDVAGYTPGVWDVDLLGQRSEEVVFGGVTGYHVTASTD